MRYIKYYEDVKIDFDDWDDEEVEPKYLTKNDVKPGDRIIVSDALYDYYPKWIKSIKNDIGKTIFYVVRVTSSKLYKFHCLALKRNKDDFDFEFYIPIHMGIKVDDIKEDYKDLCI